MPTATGHTTAIRAKTVIGTTVKDSGGHRIGEIEDIVLDKSSNNIMFAVVGFGGVMGMGEKFHPLPWAVLNYDENDNCYVVPHSKEELETAPAHTLDELTRNDGMGARESSYSFFKARPYWQ